MNTKVSAGFNLFDPNPNRVKQQEHGNERLNMLARVSSVSPDRMMRAAANNKRANRNSNFI